MILNLLELVEEQLRPSKKQLSMHQICDLIDGTRRRSRIWRCSQQRRRSRKLPCAQGRSWPRRPRNLSAKISSAPRSKGRESAERKPFDRMDVAKGSSCGASASRVCGGEGVSKFDVLRCCCFLTRVERLIKCYSNGFVNFDTLNTAFLTHLIEELAIHFVKVES
jgi:hypothetical protein